MSTALSVITAAVVVVILNLGIRFSLHTLFAQVSEVSAGPLHISVRVWNTVEWGAVFITLAALGFSFRLKWDMLRTIGVCIVLGLIESVH